MKKQRVDYTGLSLRTLKDPQFSHLLLIIGWPVYFLFFFITENLIPAERFHAIHCGLDDLIPFNEFFLIFYAGWYVLIAGSLLYGIFYDVERFREMQTYIIITQVIGVLVYLIYPSIQYLRPEVFPRQNILTAVMGLIYAFDTNTGVFPSMHVAFSLAVLSVGLKDRDLKPLTKAGLLFVVVMICLAVCFVKQHSALDILGAAVTCLVAEIIVFGKKYWAPRFTKTTELSYKGE
jgi:membrane-associated phospholipid phosphatase